MNITPTLAPIGNNALSRSFSKVASIQHVKPVCGIKRESFPIIGHSHLMKQKFPEKFFFHVSI